MWCLYDFANSIVMIAFFLYFSQWLVVDRKVSDLWFNTTLIASSLIYLFFGPVLGSIADRSGNKTTGIRVTTILAAALYFITGLVAVSYPTHEVVASIFFTLGSAAYLLSFIYYNSFLDELAPPEKRGVVSGWGLFGNYLGQIAAIFVTLPFATNALHLWGNPGRAQAFIPATLLFLLLALPMLVYFKEKKPRKVEKIKIKDEYKNTFQSFVTLCKTPGLGRFFLAYFFFNDAVITASNNFPIYMDQVFKTNDTIKSFILLCILVSAAIGAPLSGWIADRIGLKKTLLGTLFGWLIIFPILSFVQHVSILVFFVILMGLLFGAVWTITRAMVIEFTPAGSLNKSYTYYTLMERFATLVGPVSWGLIVAFAPHHNALNYRAAAFSMSVFICIGLLIARKLPTSIKAKP